MKSALIVILLIAIVWLGSAMFSAPAVETEDDTTALNADDTMQNTDSTSAMPTGDARAQETVVNEIEQVTLPRATLKTNKGDIVIELFAERMPITVENFLKLARDNFYDGTKFHRVMPNFMVQGGDPNSAGDDPALYGRGGPGYTIDDEFVDGLSNVRGTIAMANTGMPNSGGSQFFINVVNNTMLDYDKEPLTSKHPVFGRVVEGIDVVDAIAQVETHAVGGAQNVPVDPVVITDIVVE